MTAATLARPAPARAAKVRRQRAPLPPVTLSLLIVGAVALWLLAFALLLSGVQEQRAQRGLYAQFRQQLAEATAPVGGAIAAGRPVALLKVPALGLDTVVVEGTSPTQTRLGPGHRVGSVLPGQPGVSVIFGRSLTYGGAFADLGSLRAKEVVTVTTGEGTSRFEVTGVRRPGSPLPTPVSPGESRLVLASVEGGPGLARLTPHTPVYVDLKLLGKALPPAVAVMADPSPSAALLGADSAPLVGLVLWLQALLVASLGVVWAARRWGVWPTWLVGLPALLAASWGASDSLTQLLPNVV